MPQESTLYFEIEMVNIRDGTEIDMFSDMDTDRDGKLTGDIDLAHYSLFHGHKPQKEQGGSPPPPHTSS